MADKSELRLMALKRRDGLPLDARVSASLSICNHAREIPFEAGNVISGYMPIRSEADIRPVMADLRDRGARLCLPAVLDRETIVFRELVRGADLVATGFGTVGPSESAAVLDPQILLMPLAAFDDKGHRLGYGAGHYDRAVARLKAKGVSYRLIGVGFDCQELEKVPAEPHDVPLDAILTESGLRLFSSGD